jgi:hypothetical protein
MTGAIIQLVAYGVQDLYLTGDPEITFFKIVYRRYTNFAIESVKQTFSSQPNFGQKVTCTLGRVGDLVAQMFLYVRLPPVPKFINEFTGEEDLVKKFAWVRYIGYALIKEMTFEIGGKLIDRQYGEWLYIWEQLTTRQNNASTKLVGNVPYLYDFTNGKGPADLFIPLKYYFNQNNGIALPLIALASIDVKMTFTFRRAEECYRIGPTYSIKMDGDMVPFRPGDYIAQTVRGETIHGYVIHFDYLTRQLYYIKIVSPCAKIKSFDSICPIYNPITLEESTAMPGCCEVFEPTPLELPLCLVQSWLYVNYIFLDNDERLKFARASHEYLMQQIQYNQLIGIQSANIQQSLMNMSHPCKAHYWVAHLDSLVGPRTINDLFNFTSSPVRYPDGQLFGRDLVQKAKLLLNGQDRFHTRSWHYFNLEEPYSYHYRGPVPGINVYSFCLNPEDYQPSGSINMSRFDYIIMKMKLDRVINPQNSCTVRAYTLNYNILRIFFNLGGLAFV